MTRVPIPPWTPDWPVTVQERFIRVSASHLRGQESAECAAQIAAKARPGVVVDNGPSHRAVYAPYQSFALGLARDAAFAVLARGADPRDALVEAVAKSPAQVADASADVAREALTGYLIAVERLRDDGDLPPDTLVREFFAVDEAEDDQVRVEWSAWGLLHVSPDGALREFHILTWNAAGSRMRPDSYLAVCARAAADAVIRSEGQPWRSSWTPSPRQPGEGVQVRLREIGMLDASDALLLDVTPQQARADFGEAVKDRVQVLSGLGFNSGSRCATCAGRYQCRGIVRLPGVLGVAGPSTWTRALSPGDLTSARVCTWQVHLERDLGVPRDRQESTEAMARGSRLHEWLEHAHGRLSPCSPDDLPPPGQGVGEVAERLGWDQGTYAALRPYLLQHLPGCPLREEGLIAAVPELTLSAWDTDADVVMTTRADIVVETESRIVVRETKSVAEASIPETSSEVFERYPQIAVTLCLLADGLSPFGAPSPLVVHVEGRVPPPTFVQLELLSPEGCEVRTFSPDDPETVLLARTVVAEAVDTILYSDPVPNPGRWCAWCPVSRWCYAKASSDAGVGTVPEAPEEPTGHPAAVPSRVALLAYAEDISAPDEEIPF